MFIHVSSLIATVTPVPTAPPDDLVTPGWVGFVVTGLVAVLVIFLIFDMSRRLRRVRYRAEINAKLDAEERGEFIEEDDESK